MKNKGTIIFKVLSILSIVTALILAFVKPKGLDTFDETYILCSRLAWFFIGLANIFLGISLFLEKERSIESRVIRLIVLTIVGIGFIWINVLAK